MVGWFFESHSLPQSQPLAEMEKLLLDLLFALLGVRTHAKDSFSVKVKENTLRRCQVPTEAHGEARSWAGRFPTSAETPAMQMHAYHT